MGDGVQGPVLYEEGQEDGGEVTTGKVWNGVEVHLVWDTAGTGSKRREQRLEEQVQLLCVVVIHSFPGFVVALVFPLMVVGAENTGRYCYVQVVYVDALIAKLLRTFHLTLELCPLFVVGRYVSLLTRWRSCLGRRLKRSYQR